MNRKSLARSRFSKLNERKASPQQGTSGTHTGRAYATALPYLGMDMVISTNWSTGPSADLRDDELHGCSGGERPVRAHVRAAVTHGHVSHLSPSNSFSASWSAAFGAMRNSTLTFSFVSCAGFSDNTCMMDA